MGCHSNEKALEAAIDDNADSPSHDSIKRTTSGLKLEPQPSDDPRDPLNWPMFKKIYTLVILSFASFTGIGQATCNQGSLVIQGQLYNKTPTQVANSISTAAAGLATGPFLWAWLSRHVGRGSVIFWAMLCNLGVNVWSGCMTGPNDYIPFVLSRWLGGTLGSAPATIGAGIIIDIFYLHQRGKAFACYTIATTFGPQVSGTLSGYIVDTAPWPVQFWWTIAALAAVLVLFFFFMEDTTYDRANSSRANEIPRSYIRNRITTFFPGTAVVQEPASQYHFLDPIVIGLQPVTIFGGIFLTLTFGWAVAVTTLLGVFTESPVSEGGYGFSPLGYGNITLAQWVGVAIAETYGLLFNDRLPLWRCRRNGGVWRPEHRLYPLLVPCLVILPAGLGIFGAALQYHLHYMVLAFAVCIINITETALVPVMNNYVCECFVGHAQEVTTVLNFYRLILGLTVTFYISQWTTAVGAGWAFGTMGLIALVGFCFTIILAWKGRVIRDWSSDKFKQSEDGDKLF